MIDRVRISTLPQLLIKTSFFGFDSLVPLLTLRELHSFEKAIRHDKSRDIADTPTVTIGRLRKHCAVFVLRELTPSVLPISIGSEDLLKCIRFNVPKTHSPITNRDFTAFNDAYKRSEIIYTYNPRRQ